MQLDLAFYFFAHCILFLMIQACPLEARSQDLPSKGIKMHALPL
jgi:hypothetical protein